MVKPGYKQTEIGMIPEDWEEAIFGKKVSIFRGGSPRPIQNYLTDSDDGVNWIKIGDVTVNGKYVTKTEEKIRPEGVSRSREVHLGDFILSNSMSFGRPYIVKIDGCIHDGWLTIQNYTSAFTTDYLYYLLSSDMVYKQYLAMAAGSSVKNLNKDKVGSLIVVYPETPEQKRIAEALSDMDELIASIEKLIAKKKAVKQGAMQELLTGKRRLPGFSGEWNAVELRKLGRFVGGGTPSTNNLDWWKGKTPWISSSDLEENQIRTIKMSRYITEEAISHSATNLCPAGAILVVSRVGVGKVAVAPVDLCTSQDFTNIIVNNCNSFFLAYTLSIVMKEKAATTQGTSIKGVTSDEIAAIKVRIPSRLEQDAIVSALDSIDEDIRSIEKQNLKAHQIKQGMMQQLLTGKIRIV